MNEDDQARDKGSISIGGNVGPGGAVGHSAHVQADIIAGGDVSVGDTRSLDEAAEAFRVIYDAVSSKKFESEDEAQEVRQAIAVIENQNKKGEQASESVLRAKFQTLAIMAPDILEVAIATLANPLTGLSTVVRKVAEKAKTGTDI